MTVNLNDLPYTKPFISEENILKHISEWDIFKHYVSSDIKLKEAISSPFRNDDTPSFAVYQNKHGKLLYNDFVLGGGNCFQLVKYLFGYNRWFDVYSRIAIDFWLDKTYHCNEKIKSSTYVVKPTIGSKPDIKKELNLGVKIRSWKDHDIEYWSSYGISLKTLHFYNVYPIEYIIFKTQSRKDKVIKAEKYAYCYVEKKDGKVTYKIYQPFSKYKWFGNVNNSIWQGWSNLPEHSDILIITKSLKDIMSIHDICKIPSVSLQSEKIKPKLKILNDLKKRFSVIFVFYDNDYDKKSNYGQIFANELCDEYKLINIRIPDIYKSKDFTDLVNNFGEDVARDILEKLISDKLVKRNKGINDVPF